MSDKSLRLEYVSHINRVIDYIHSNLDGDLSLKILSIVACFSRYHFHRVFGAIVGEPLGQFIHRHRIRIEKAALQLITYPETPFNLALS